MRDKLSIEKKKKLKFAVRSAKDGYIKSDIWIAWSINDDIYIAPQSSSGIHKISLHTSGVCNYSLTSELMSHSPPTPNGTRRIINWKRSSFDGVDHTKVLELIFILTANNNTHQVNTADLTLVPDAPFGFATEVSLFYSHSNPLDWKSKIWPTSNIMAVWLLPSGAYVCFRRRVIGFPANEMERVLEIGNNRTMMVIGERSPEVVSGGPSALMLSESRPHLGRLYIFEKVDVSGKMGRTTDWFTRTGHRPFKAIES